MRRWTSGKKWIGVALTALMLAVFWAPASFAQEGPSASAYLVMDADTGQVLLEKNGAQRCYPASLTKIMTLALALEQGGGNLQTPVTVSRTACTSMDEGASRAGFVPGEEITLGDAWYGALLVSGNEAANVLAEYTSGSLEEFVNRMNEQADTLGMAGTHFVNAHGMHHEAHYTTPYDMALLTQWALSVPGFARGWGASEYWAGPTNVSGGRVFETDNLMLRPQTPYTYSGCTGGKSGWTPQAQFTMVETAQRDGRTLICVVMGVPEQYGKFQDCTTLLDRAFAGETQELSPAVHRAQMMAADQNGGQAMAETTGKDAGSNTNIQGRAEWPHAAEAGGGSLQKDQASPSEAMGRLVQYLLWAAGIMCVVAAGRTLIGHVKAAARRMARRRAARQIAAFAQKAPSGAKTAHVHLHIGGDGLFLKLRGGWRR